MIRPHSLPRCALRLVTLLALAGCSNSAPYAGSSSSSGGHLPADTGPGAALGGSVVAAGVGGEGALGGNSTPGTGGIGGRSSELDSSMGAGGEAGAVPEGGREASALEASTLWDWHAAFDSLETVAGTGKSDSGNEWKPEFEGGPATQAELSRPHMAQADAAGNIYIADKESHGIRRIDASGRIWTAAGINTAGDGPDDERPATEVALSSPNGVWVQPDGTFYILDLDNGKIRKVTPNGMMRTLFKVKSGTDVGRGLWVASDESEVLVCAGTQLLRWKPTSGTQVLATGFVELGTVFKDDAGTIWIGDRGASLVYRIVGGEKRVFAGTGGQGPFVDGSQAGATPMPGARAVWPYQGGLFVGLHEGSRVLYVDANQTAHIFLNGVKDAHAGDGGRFDAPIPDKKVSEIRSVTVAPWGDIIVVESDVGFVRVVRAVRP